MPSFGKSPGFGNIGARKGIFAPGMHPDAYPARRTIPGKANFSISGITRDLTGTPLGNCNVILFRTGSNVALATTTSDGSGNFTFIVADNAGYFFMAAFDPSGNPAGITANTIVATQV